MGSIVKDQIMITPLNIISTDGGDVLHGLKNTDISYINFGEAYFSRIKYKAIKGWKKHNLMTMNLIVPIGSINFVFYSEIDNEFRSEIVGEENYCRITIPPKIWFAFQGLNKKENLLLNISNILHDPNEVIRVNINEFNYNWK
jgi:dTDP-4-dehydrorhamnose 3,5-epimerase